MTPTAHKRKEINLLKKLRGEKPSIKERHRNNQRNESQTNAIKSMRENNQITVTEINVELEKVIIYLSTIEEKQRKWGSTNKDCETHK